MLKESDREKFVDIVADYFILNPQAITWVNDGWHGGSTPRKIAYAGLLAGEIFDTMRAAGLVEPKPREAGWYWVECAAFFGSLKKRPLWWNGTWWDVSPRPPDWRLPRPIIEPTWIGPRIPEPGE